VVIRPATRADAAAIARVHVDSWRTAYRNILPAGYLDRLHAGDLAQRWARQLRTRPDDILVVCSPDEVVVGFAVVGGCTDGAELAGFAGEVSMLYLIPSAIGCGLGAALWRACTAKLAGRNYRWLTVWVLAANRDGRAFYRHCGLRPDGAHRFDYFREQAVEVVRYAGPLNPVAELATLFGRAR
jgi:GNAT superfamily N-acetyltransferase